MYFLEVSNKIRGILLQSKKLFNYYVHVLVHCTYLITLAYQVCTLLFIHNLG